MGKRSQSVALCQNEYEVGGEGYEYAPISSLEHTVLTKCTQPVHAKENQFLFIECQMTAVEIR